MIDTPHPARRPASTAAGRCSTSSRGSTTICSASPTLSAASISRIRRNDRVRLRLLRLGVPRSRPLGPRPGRRLRREDEHLHDFGTDRRGRTRRLGRPSGTDAEESPPAGIRGEAIVESMIGLGTSSSDVDLAMSAVYANNRDLIDDETDRRFLVRDGNQLRRQPTRGGQPAGAPRLRGSGRPRDPRRRLRVARARGRPDREERVWLKGLGCFQYTRDVLQYTGEEIDVVREGDVDVVHWVPAARASPSKCGRWTATSPDGPNPASPTSRPTSWSSSCESGSPDRPSGGRSGRGDGRVLHPQLTGVTQPSRGPKRRRCGDSIRGPDWWNVPVSEPLIAPVGNVGRGPRSSVRVSLCTRLLNLARIIFAPLRRLYRGVRDRRGDGRSHRYARVDRERLLRLPTGWILTKVPRHHVVIGSGVVLAVSSSIAATSTTVPQLMVGAFFMGIASGIYFVSANPLLSELYPDRVGRVVGIHGTASQIAAVIAAPFVVLTLLIDWRLAVDDRRRRCGSDGLHRVVSRRTEMPTAGEADRDFVAGALSEWRIIVAALAIAGWLRSSGRACSTSTNCTCNRKVSPAGGRHHAHDRLRGRRPRVLLRR